MAKLRCTICEKKNTIPESKKEGDRITCFNCNAQLRIVIENGKKILRCVFCKNEQMECQKDCETRFNIKEKLGFFDIKLD